MELALEQNEFTNEFVNCTVFSGSAFAVSTTVGANTGTPTVTAASSALPVSTTTPAVLPLKDGSIEFFAIGKPSMLKIHGESTKMTGTVNRTGNTLSGVFQIPLDSFETGMAVRNNHLKEKVFETSKFTNAKLTIDSLVIPDGKTGEIKDLPFTGKLNLHGVDRDISGTATVTASVKSVAFIADFQMKMSDYRIPPPEFMGMSMKDDVKVSVKGEAKSN